MRARDDIVDAMNRHADTVMRVCSLYLREQADRDDAFQDCFFKYANSDAVFQDEEHKKAWLIVVASNVCKDQLKRSSTRVLSLEEAPEPQSTYDVDEQVFDRLEISEVLDGLHKLDERYRVVLYMKYFEGMDAPAIARTLEIPENTVYTQLSRGRELLKGVLSHGR
ncbi:MAG: sigma-70 family RNA polymerase sigma factor [Atopobiaceae bacterium]|nr:sigma-70 family RNA polymerase sigma factor [Atopobiaceae bacterium]